MERLEDGGFEPGAGAATFDRRPGVERIEIGDFLRVSVALERVILEGTVLHQLGVEAAVGGVVDVLEKHAVELRADRCAGVRGGDRRRNPMCGGRGGRGGGRGRPEGEHEGWKEQDGAQAGGVGHGRSG
jgi:hypothetical protein